MKIMKKKVIAIVSIPQECGASTIDFVSMTNGKRIKSFNIDGFYNYCCMKKVYHDVIVSDIVTFYDRCTRNRYEIGEFERLFGCLVYEDKECKKRAKFPLSQACAILSREDCGVIGTFEYNGEIKELHSWKYTAAEIDRTVEEVWDEEADYFYHEVKNELGIELPFPKRCGMNDDDLVALFADKLNYDVINILRY